MREELRLGLGLRLPGHRDVPEGHPVEVGGGLQGRVVGHDRDDVEIELADRVAEQQVVEAVRVLADHDEHALPLGGVGDAPGHVEPLGDVPEGLAQVREVQRCTVGVRELDPHVEHAAHGAVELVALHDRALLLHEQPGHRVHDPRGVLAGQHQDTVLCVGGSRHCAS